MQTFIFVEGEPFVAEICVICKARVYPAELLDAHIARHIKTRDVIKAYARDINLKAFNRKFGIDFQRKR